MGRKNNSSGRQQASKRSRRVRKQAKWAFGEESGIWWYIEHPSHVSGDRYVRHKPRNKHQHTKPAIEKLLDRL